MRSTPFGPVVTTLMLACSLVIFGCEMPLGLPTSTGDGWGGSGFPVPPPSPSTPFAGCTAAAPLTIGAAIDGTLGAGPCSFSGRHIDRFDFTITQTTNIDIDLRATFDGYLYLFDPAGTLIHLNDNYLGTDRSRLLVALAPGQYSVGVSSFSAEVRGAYRLSATLIPLQLGCDSVATHVLGSTAQGSLAEGDCTLGGVLLDRWTFNVPAQGSVTFDADATFDVQLLLLDGEGRLLRESPASGAIHYAWLSAPLDAGSYSIAIAAREAAAAGTYSIASRRH